MPFGNIPLVCGERVAAAITGSPMTAPHSAYDLLAVRIIDPRSYRSDTSRNRVAASIGSIVAEDNSSRIRTLGFVSIRSRVSNRPRACALRRSVSIACTVVKYTPYQLRMASMPRAIAKWVFQTPGGPRRMMFSCRSMKLKVANSRTNRSSHRRLKGEVKVCQGLGKGKSREFHPGTDEPFLPRFHLGGQQIPEELDETAPPRCCRLRCTSHDRGCLIQSQLGEDPLNPY